MEYDVEKVAAPGRKEVGLLGATYEKGKPYGEKAGQWSHKLKDRQQILKYLETAERYRYSNDWFGSERRKNPA